MHFIGLLRSCVYAVRFVMSQLKFILSSPETKTAGNVNWKLCFICQNLFDKSPLTSPGRG